MARRKQSGDPLERVREICFALPEVTEKMAWGSPTFRAAGGMFAMFLDDHHGDGRLALWCKATAEAQEILVGADPESFFVPPYVGHQGWIGVRLDRSLGWDVVAELLADAHRMAQPKRRVAPARETARRRGSRAR